MNIEPETRKGYYISAEMKKVWAVEMALLKKLLEVCEKHNLRIWAEGGTMLGTVREKGYIPWDDDIDMAMLRDDYDKLQKIAKEEFKAPFFFQSGYTDLFPSGFSKLRMDGTAAIIPYEINQNFHQGIFIDIFCYDAVPDNKDDFEKQRKKGKQKIKQLKIYCDPYWSFTDFKHNWKVVKAKWEVWRKGFTKCFQEYDNIYRQFKISDNKYISFIAFYYELDRYLRDKHWYDETIYLPFEDIMMPVPKDFDKILTLQYGNYMKPVKAPTMHGNFEVLDTEKSYLEHLPAIRKKHNNDNWIQRKNRLLSILKRRK